VTADEGEYAKTIQAKIYIVRSVAHVMMLINNRLTELDDVRSAWERQQEKKRRKKQ
jgi:hypothetical protein